jgi:multidrug efflux pump
MMLSDLSVRRPVFAAVAAIILCVIGAAAFVALPVRELPNIDPPSVSVTTTYRGASAEVVEERITQVIERQVSGIQGIDRVGSSSRDGVSRINVAFTLDVDLNEAANDVRDAVSRVISRLPDEVDPPQIAKADADAQPIMILQMASPNMNRLQLTDYANRYLVERLSTVPGVAQVNVAGALNYSMRIWLNPEAMAARGVTVQDVQTALLNQNLELPAGSLEAKDKDFTVRVARAYSRPDQFALMPIALPARAVPVTSAAVGAASPGASAGALPAVQSSTNATDYIVRLGDIARVEEGADEPRRVFRVNGVDQVGLTIQRQSQANDLQIADDINKALEDIRPTLPKGMTIVVGVDNTEFTREALHEVWITMAISLGLVALVNFIFLGSWRAALIPTIVAPICILATFTVLAALGFSLNLLTLLALILAIGLVVDDAIVVVENIQRRIDEGEPPLLGAERGARQVFFAVVATTAVLMAVFAPLMFMPGYVGRLFVELAVAVAGAVFFSALMALSLSPMLASKLLRPASNSGWLARNVDHAVDSVRESYRRSLDGMLGRKSTTFITGGLVVVLMLAAGGLYMALPKELVPLEDRGRVDLSFQAPEGSGFDYTARAVTEVERRARVMYDKGEITRYFVTQPTFGQNQFNTGGGFMNLPKEGKVNSLQLAAQLNRNFSDITSARVIASVRPSIQRPGAPGGGAPGLDLIVMGNEYPQIEAQIKPLLRAAEGNPGMARARLAYEPTSPRILVAMDRDKAAALGVSANAVGTALQTLFGSAQVTTYIKNGQEYDVILQTGSPRTT